MISYADGINADKWASDFMMTTQDLGELGRAEVTNNDEIKIHLAPGGGWVVKVG